MNKERADEILRSYGGERGDGMVECRTSGDSVVDALAWALVEVDRLRTVVNRLREDMGTISDKLGSVISTIPQGERSDTFIKVIDAANRIAFTAWRETIEKVRAT